MDNESQKSKGTYWVWNGIVMRWDVTTEGKKIRTNVTRLRENASIPASQFQVPAGIEFTEMKTK